MSLSYYKLAVILDKDAGGQNGAANQALQIYKSDGLTLASVYSDAAGTSPIAQPGAVTDANGNFEFYATAGTYVAKSASFELEIKVGTDATIKTFATLQDAKDYDSFSVDGINFGEVVGLGKFEIVSTNPGGYFVELTKGGLYIKPIGEVHVKMFGCVCDGATDDTTAFTNAVNAPNRVKADIDDQILITAPVVGPSNKGMSFNGAKILMGATEASSSPILSLGTKCTVKDLEIEVQTGFTVNRGFVVGTNSFVKNLKVSSVDQQANTGLTNHAAVRLVGDNIIGENITVSNWDQQILLSGNKIAFNGKSNSYVRGLYADVCDNLTVENYHAETASANATTSPGHNGILLSEVRYSNISDYIIEDAGEHGVRIGSSTTNGSRDIAFSNGQVIRPGQCGFKAFSSTQRTANITINGLNVVDCSFGGSSSSNEDGLRLQNVDGCTVTGFTTKKKDNPGTGSYNGIYISGCTDINIDAPYIRDSNQEGILLIDTDGLVNQIWITNPNIKSTGSDAVKISSPTQILRDIYITGVNIASQTGYGVNIDASGGVAEPVVVTGNVDPTGSGIVNSPAVTNLITLDLNSTENTGANNEATIATGAITLPTRAKQQIVFVDTEADAASDTLSTINQVNIGDIVILKAISSARTVVVDEAGNIKLGAASRTLDNGEDTLVLVYTGPNWQEMSFSDNGA